MIDIGALILHPSRMCPRNSKYGAKVVKNIASAPQKYGEKIWQLRSVRVRSAPNKYEWRLLPFLLSTGVSEWNTPIICDKAIEHCGLYPGAYRGNSAPHFEDFYIPQPFKTIQAPLCCDWDKDHLQKIRTSPQFRYSSPMQYYDIRCNLIGGSLAHIILEISFAFSYYFNKKLEVDVDAIVETILLQWGETSEFGNKYGPTEESVREECHAQQVGYESRKQGYEWTEKTLPIKSEYFVNE
jgi:hypothetical protein